MKKQFLLIFLPLLSVTLANAQTTASNGILQAASGYNLRLRTYNSADWVTIPYSGSYTGFVGIGTSPTEKLHVNGNARANDFNSINGVFNATNSTALYLQTNGTNRLTILNSNGFVGIGTVSPAYNLDVNGTINASTLRMNGANVVSSQWLSSGSNISYTSGMVSIGTTAIPTGYKLAVGGKIVCEEVVVKLQANWPDFVFEPDYNLLPLDELQRFIANHKHLPGIPSASEIAENGVSLADMNAKLLQKIEELTLYLIEQDKRIKQLEEDNYQLKKK
jgi:hypothetical protein